MTPKNPFYCDLEKTLSKAPKKPPLHFEGLSWFQPAAVLVLFYQEGGDNFIVLTKRSEEVLHHKGQICFPGGTHDESDASLWHTALRETKEEIGLDPAKINCLGELCPVTTPTGFHITPYVALGNPPFHFFPNLREIAEIFPVPFTHLLNPKNFHIEPKTYFGVLYNDPVFTYNSHKIWGATARILVELLDHAKPLFK